MKKLIFLLFISSFYICFGQENESEYISSFNKFINLIGGYREIPKDLIKKYLGEKWIDTEDPHRSFKGDEFTPFKIGNTTFVAVRHSVYGICSVVTLFSFDSMGKLISSLEIECGCDHTSNNPVSKGKGYKLISNNTIIIFDYKSVATDMKNSNYDYFESEKDEYEKYQFYSLLPNGSFSLLESTEYILINLEKPNTSNKLLNDWRLEEYSKKDLRILRNEIFAKKGYIFKSDDLREYFEKFEWYKPISRDVNELMSLIEKSNIQIILEAEKKKEAENKANKENATIVIDGYFVLIDKKTIYNSLGDYQIKDTTYINPDSAYKTTGLMGDKGLFLISTDMPSLEILSRFSEYMFYDRMPIYIVNDTDTINDPSGINPASVDSIILIAPYKAALKYGWQYNGGIGKIYIND